MARGDLAAGDVILTRRDAYEYVLGQLLLVLGLLALVFSMATTSDLPFILGMVVGFFGQIFRTRVLNRAIARISDPEPSMPWWRAQGWMQRQLDRPTVARHAIAVIRKRS